ncbi:MAG TPA: TlpA disulfide reductase family protein [Thermoleophilaceae bacterium]|nr:TlpA disulfide reductase family protein [Thermoleophilaceae bacterium]
MRRLGVLAVCALALVACGSDEPKSAGKPNPGALSGAPAPLAALHRQANQLLGGGPDAFTTRLRELRGYPVVVNKWASWCGPCRGEFPYFQRQAVRRGKRIAFLGVDSQDNDADARSFLRQFPVSYPSYRDEKLGIAAVFNGVQAFPTTAFYDSKGTLAFVHQGGYASEPKLVEDIERYAR